MSLLYLRSKENILGVYSDEHWVTYNVSEKYGSNYRVDSLVVICSGDL